MLVEISKAGFDPWQRLATFQDQMRIQRDPQGDQQRAQYGATAVFVGTLRDFNEDITVKSMVLEHYPGMTERHLRRIAEEALSRWDILDVLIIHRVGQLLPDDPIVLTAAWSAHRAAAFDACRFLIDDLKTRAPFWKKETTHSGARWVEKNT